VNEDRIAGNDGPDEVGHYLGPVALLTRTDGQTVLSRFEDAHRHAFVGTRDAVGVGVGAAHSITLVFRSSSSCS
jgi:hypothetical protein